MIAAAIGLLILGNAPQQQPKAARKSETKAAQHPSPQEGERSSSGAQDSGCAGANIANMSCDAATAEATIRQADLMHGSNIISLVTAIVAGAAAAFAWSASKAAQETLRHERTKSAAELRPWVKIDVIVSKFEIDEVGFSLGYTVVFKNIGRTTAQHFTFKMKADFSRLDTEIVNARFAEWHPPKDCSNSAALMPDEERGFSGFHSCLRHKIPWHGILKRKSASYVVTASAFYWSAMDSQWHRTDRSFSIGRKDDSITSGIIIPDDMVGTGPELVTVKPFWAGQTS